MPEDQSASPNPVSATAAPVHPAAGPAAPVQSVGPTPVLPAMPLVSPNAAMSLAGSNYRRSPRRLVIGVCLAVLVLALGFGSYFILAHPFGAKGAVAPTYTDLTRDLQVPLLNSDNNLTALGANLKDADTALDDASGDLGQ